MTIAKSSCKIEGCDNQIQTKYLCRAHYQRSRKANPDYTKPIQIIVKGGAGTLACTRQGCSKPQHSKGLCNSCYSKAYNDSHRENRSAYRGKYHSAKPLHSVWSGMIQRCNNPKAPMYSYYGGRGITVCQRWLDSYDNFVKDMGDRPTQTTLDRINSNGNYEPSNCRWATKTVQSINKRKRKNKSGHTGIYWYEQHNKWCAAITINKRKLSLGYYSELSDAITARKKAEEVYFKPLL